MSNVIILMLLPCVLAGIIAEIITIAMPEKVMVLVKDNPEELMHKPFYKRLLLLSGIYLFAIVLLLFFGIPRFKLYGFLLLSFSLCSWLNRPFLEKWPVVIIVQSTINLTLLVDVERILLFSFL